jgi:hypothetical protein
LSTYLKIKSANVVPKTMVVIAKITNQESALALDGAGFGAREKSIFGMCVTLKQSLMVVAPDVPTNRYQPRRARLGRKADRQFSMAVFRNIAAAQRPCRKLMDAG